MEWPPKKINEGNKDDVLEIDQKVTKTKVNELVYGKHEQIGGYDFYPEKMEVIGSYKNIKDDDFGELIKNIANADSLKIFLKNENEKLVQITSQELRDLKEKNRKNIIKLPDAYLNLFTQNRLNRPTQNLGQFFEMNPIDAKILFNIEPEQMDSWHKKYESILNKFTIDKGIKYDGASIDDKEKMANELDFLLKTMYEEHFGIKSGEQLFKTKIN